MMEKYFVTYNQALALKDLGFDEPCFSAFINKELRGSGWINLNVDGLYQNSIHSGIIKNLITSPTFSQCFRWFREKYELYHVIHHFEHNKDTPKEFLSEVSGKLSMLNDDIDGFSYHSTYEQAELACIDKLIEMVKK